MTAPVKKTAPISNLVSMAMLFVPLTENHLHSLMYNF
jgi:hypothetical protein